MATNAHIAASPRSPSLALSPRSPRPPPIAPPARSPLGTERPDEIGLMASRRHVRDSKKPKADGLFRAGELPPGRPGPPGRHRHGAARLRADLPHRPESEPTVPNDVMLGTPVDDGRPRSAPSTADAPSPSARRLAERRLLRAAHGPGARVGYAPFVLAPAQLGEHRVAVVMPTQTWQAYNFRDDDGDGSATRGTPAASTLTARLGRPFLNRGVPPHYRERTTRRFVRWLAQHGTATSTSSPTPSSTARRRPHARTARTT